MRRVCFVESKLEWEFLTLISPDNFAKNVFFASINKKPFLILPTVIGEFFLFPLEPDNAFEGPIYIRKFRLQNFENSRLTLV